MSVLQQMLAQYHRQNINEYRNAMKEIIQEIALCGISRSGFFNIGAFYGGTALRIFYDLPRFSEDMDFSLLSPDETFSIKKFLPAIEQELSAMGLEMSAEEKNKSRLSPIKSAFIKGNTQVQIISIAGNLPELQEINKHEVLKIKLEVDTNPPAGAGYEVKYNFQPAPAMVRLYDMPSLFAGKVHAVLCRGWQNRIKGRDLYDFIWYIANKTPINLLHLQKRLEQSNKWDKEEILTLEAVKQMLNERFAAMDFQEAKKDIIPFIKNPSEAEFWSAEMFQAAAENLKEAD